MSLLEYRRKRQFGLTREPEPGEALPPGQRAMFVVQLHHASRRHYDFRLQVGDALKSWAVPKGPSYDPKVKRMAVEVEDHPVSYAGFEGDIPKGQYGGGHVAQFDRGVWATDGEAEAQLAKGHLRFELFGRKLKGKWHLVRSGKPAKQPQWLLFKEPDAYASALEADDLLGDVTPPPAADVRRAGSGKAVRKRATSVAPKKAGRRIRWADRAAKLDKARRATLADAAFAPQLAKLGERPPEGAQWLHELKWDGYRIVATVVDGHVRLWSRNAIEWTQRVPEVREAIERLGLASAALDGELIAGAGKREDFNLLQATLSGERQGALSYVLFDLLHLEGVDLRKTPLVERKALLAQLLERPVAHLAYSSHVEGDGAAALALASRDAFEGIISKRADRPYHAGRNDEWRKTKEQSSEEFAVVGYTPGKGSRNGFGSLLLARPDGQGRWRYAGRIGSGFGNEQLRELTARIGKAGSAMPSVQVAASTVKEIGKALWFPPMFVVEALTRGHGSSGVLRQASLKAVRPDKDVADLLDSDRGSMGKGMKTKARQGGAGSTKKAASPARSGKSRKSRQPASLAPVQLSSPTKLIYPDDGLTKRDVFDYYQAVMDHLLPEVAGRPLSVIRCPSGTGKACFFQKHHTAGLERVDLVRLKEESGNAGDYLVVNDAQGLLELVQFNAIEFHPWGAHADRPDVADRVVFDLDPGPKVDFAEVRRAATHVRRLLAGLELESFLRTTGGKGLHVVVPLNPGCDWKLVKRFAHGFASALAQSEPQRFLAVSTLKLRPGKIFVDYLRNSRGATSVASYSLRARAGAPVAMPLAWSALSKLKKGDAFTLVDVPAMLRRRRSDPWAGIDRIRQDLSRWSGNG